MFGKKKEAKIKEPSHRDLLLARIISEIEQLAPGQSLIYKLPEPYWKSFAAFLITEINPSYPEKGKKYYIYRDGILDGKPIGKKSVVLETNKPNDIAQRIIDCDEGGFGPIERYH